MVLQNESAVVPASGDEYESGDKDLEDLNDLTHEVEPTNVIEKGKTAYGRDCVVVAGCGSGKFLSYQLLAGLKDESGIVVASLIALANQQAEYMKAHGVKAVAITGDNLTGDKNLWKEIEMGKYDMIFTSPELLVGSGSYFWKKIATNKESKFIRGLGWIVVDEVHYVWKWCYGAFVSDLREVAIKVLHWLRLGHSHRAIVIEECRAEETQKPSHREQSLHAVKQLPKTSLLFVCFTRDSEEECEDLRNNPSTCGVLAKATLRLYYFGKQTELEYSKLPEIEKAVVRHIVSVNFSAITLPKAVLQLSAENLQRHPDLYPHQGRNDQGLIPPVFFLEWTRDATTYQRYLQAFRESPAAVEFFQWYEQQYERGYERESEQ
ncbi:hypothetical protein EV426DRAFT_706962 [Tirmania nivea]|nr:hypothetical protein EV426DRAFT_706962 [Tirmania nivea]